MPDCQRCRIMPVKVGDAGEQPGDAAEDCCVDDPAQDVFRDGQQRLDDDGAVDLVDVVLVERAACSRRAGGGELRGALGLAAVVFVGDQPAFKRHENGDDAEDEFEDADCRWAWGDARRRRERGRR